jgi:hypothetical protein
VFCAKSDGHLSTTHTYSAPPKSQAIVGIKLVVIHLAAAVELLQLFGIVLILEQLTPITVGVVDVEVVIKNHPNHFLEGLKIMRLELI